MPKVEPRAKKMTIKVAVLKACKEIYANGGHFTGRELDARTCAHRYVAPASAGRLLAYLKEWGEIDYECIDRHKSKYRILWVKPPEQLNLLEV